MLRLIVTMLVMHAVPSWAVGHEHAHQAQAWTSYPVIEEQRGDERNRSGAQFKLVNLAAERVSVYPPTGKAGFPDGLASKPRTAWSAPVVDGKFAVSAQGMGNYYWIAVRNETPEQVTSAATVKYFANPGAAPTQMLGLAKSELEIVPQPLPREHWQYRENERWHFLVRYQRRPFPGAKVHLETAAGSRADVVADASGLVQVTFPADLPKRDNGHAGGHGMAPGGKFVLAVMHRDGSRRYLSTLNYTYSRDAMAGRSVWAGSAFMLLGGILAAPLLRRRQQEDQA